MDTLVSALPAACRNWKDSIHGGSLARLRVYQRLIFALCVVQVAVKNRAPPAPTKPTETTLQNKGSTPILHNSAASPPEADLAENNDDKQYLTGWKLHALSAAIILRAFQGIGASGIYAMILAIAPSLVPISKYAKYMGVMSTVFITASVLGPILGGVISQHSTWRWVFLLKYDPAFVLHREMLTQDHSLPGGAIAFVMVCLFLPASEESSNLSLLKVLRAKVRRSNWVRIDVLGIILLLTASVLLVFALEEGGTRYSWSNAIVIATLVLAVTLFNAFRFWEVYVEKSPNKQEPVFPPSIYKDRISSAMLLTTCFIGFPFVSMVVNIPQRAQAVYGLPPSRAGIILLPMMLTSPVATVVSGYLTGNVKVPPAYLIIIAAVLQVLGVGLTCSLSTDATHMPNAQYGYEVLMGFGFGMGLATVLTFARVVVSEANLPVMMGALTQISVLGGTVSLAICATLLNNYLKPKLSDLVSPE
ncbi:major facilitator superfamily transporter [Fusarium sp. NRRL 52700]|nr:major facilitator superfamily transporter [Fusarium sp. NRRL 52700]